MVNGYRTSMVDDLIESHQSKIRHSQMTTFLSQNKRHEDSRDTRRVPMNFIPEITKKRVLRQENMQLSIRPHGN